MSGAPVAVTGLGLMTGLGLDLASCWAGLLAGENAVRRFTLFDPEGLPTPFGVELPAGAEELFARQIMKRSRDQMTRGTMLALATAQMAIADAGLDAGGRRPRPGRRGARHDGHRATPAARRGSTSTGSCAACRTRRRPGSA